MDGSIHPVASSIFSWQYNNSGVNTIHEILVYRFLLINKPEPPGVCISSALVTLLTLLLLFAGATYVNFTCQLSTLEHTHQGKQQKHLGPLHPCAAIMNIILLDLAGIAFLSSSLDFHFIIIILNESFLGVPTILHCSRKRLCIQPFLPQLFFAFPSAISHTLPLLLSSLIIRDTQHTKESRRGQQ